MMNTTYVEYIWMDGAHPVQKLRSKTRVLPYMETPQLSDFPDWGFDGSSTNQAVGNSSDCELKPAYFTVDPLRGEGHYIVLCEVFNADGTTHETNSRAELRQMMKNGGSDFGALIGFEQEYTFFKGRDPLGWPKGGYPAPQGPFYCGIGATNVFGRDIAETHLEACALSGLTIFGINAEVMPGQWEFQIGYRGRDEEAADPLTVADHVWIARYLMHRISEDYGVIVSFDNKPVKGDWNGAGMHTNFSTKKMRDKETGKESITKAIESLQASHETHIAHYGHGLQERLTGEHETCSIDTFKSGVSDRGASIRIPLTTSKKGYGYIEDRRPGANADPYRVSARLMETICGVKAD